MERRFCIQTPDGTQYPGVSEERARTWLAQGRIQVTTLVRDEAGEEWLPFNQVFEAPQGAVCLNHPDRSAVCTCSLCAESFCELCVDAPGAFATCHQCKPPARPEDAWPRDTEATTLASEALKYAIFSIFCFGIILAPIAIHKASKAREYARENPYPSNGMGNATAALWVGWIALVFNALTLIGKLAQFAR